MLVFEGFQKCKSFVFNGLAFGMLIVLLSDIMAAHNIAYIERQLRAGKTPESLGGKKIGSGVCKTAYLFNDSFVVKANAQGGWSGIAQKNPPKWIRKYGARAPRTYKAGKYIIQEFVTPLCDSNNTWTCTPEIRAQWRRMYDARGLHQGGHDVHEYNCGTDKNGQLVVFDW